MNTKTRKTRQDVEVVSQLQDILEVIVSKTHHNHDDSNSDTNSDSNI